MKKLTEKKARRQARLNLLGVVVATGLLLWMVLSFKQLEINPFVMILIIVLMIVVDGYKSIRILSDQAYLKRYLIRHNDERNIQLEFLAYKSLSQFLNVAYAIFIVGLTIWLFEYAKFIYAHWVALAFLAFLFCAWLVFHLAKFYHGRKL